ncbi:peroxisomal membrane protein pex14 [Rhodotorula kratochvilovae]
MTSAQTSSLADLQTELKSLKSLLIARRPAAPPPTPSASSPASTPAASSAPSLPFSIKPPGLPAWQLKGSSAASTPAPAPAAAPASAQASGGYAVPGTAAVASSEGEKDPSASGVLVEKPAEGAEVEGAAADEGKGKGKAVEA